VPPRLRSFSSEEFLDFVISNPIVFVVIQDRNENIEMGEQIPQSSFGLKCDREVSTLAPLWKFLVKWVADGRDLVAQWLEQAPKYALATATR